MLTPPPDLREADLVDVLAREWALAVAWLSYQPLGFGSHHWEVRDHAGTPWFVTADELINKRMSLDEPLDVAFGRLSAALAAATDLRDHGRGFVVAPIPARTGEPLIRANQWFGVALYPFVNGQSFTWGELGADGHRRAVLDLVVAVHTAPAAARRRALTDDYAIAHRDELEVAMTGSGVPECGPYAGQASALIARNAEPIRRLLARYDALTRLSRSQPSRTVLTHGEPHPGNTMLTADGWRLIDWDTALIAPPERDLWSLDPGDGSFLAAYAEATGVPPVASALDLYRIRWDLADIAFVLSRFRRPHQGSLDDEKSWQLLRSLVERVSA